MTEILKPPLGEDGRAYSILAASPDATMPQPPFGPTADQGARTTETAPPVSPSIFERDLVRISQELWTAGHYGKLAHGFLEAEIPQFENTKQRHRGALFRDAEGAVYLPPVRYTPGQIVPEPAEPNVVRNLFMQRWGEAALPHAVLLGRPPTGTSRPSKTGATRVFDVSMGEPTSTRLARYLDATGYNDHALHGAPGKALDTLRVAAGAIKPDETRAHLDTEYIEYSELSTLMRVGLPSSSVKCLRNGIEHAVHTQITTDRPMRRGEVILEGRVDIAGARFGFERIAVSSLASLAETYGADHSIRRFLLKFR